MGFKDCNEMFGPGLYLRLSNDQDEAVVILVDEPRGRESTFRGQPHKQAMFPVVTADGLMVWTVGSRLYRKLEKVWEEIKGKCIKVVRHGVANDPQTVYTWEKVKVVPGLVTMYRKLGKATLNKLFTDLEQSDRAGENQPDEAAPF